MYYLSECQDNFEQGNLKGNEFTVKCSLLLNYNLYIVLIYIHEDFTYIL